MARTPGPNPSDSRNRLKGFLTRHRGVRPMLLTGGRFALIPVPVSPLPGPRRASPPRRGQTH